MVQRAWLSYSYFAVMGWFMLDVATMVDEFELGANSSLKLEQWGAS